MNDVIAAVLAWPLLTQVFVLAALVLVPLQISMRVKHRRVVRGWQRELDRPARSSSIVQIAGDNATQIVNAGSGSFVVQSGGDVTNLIVTTDNHGRYIVTGGNPRQAAKFKAELDRRQAVERAEAARRSRITNKVDELEQSTGTHIAVGRDANGNPVFKKDVGPQSLSEYRNGLLATTWCAGCDDWQVKVTHMGWTVDGLYRCRVCRGVTAVRECEADDAPEPPVANLQQQLHDVVTYAENDAVWHRRLPIVGVVRPWTLTTPTIDPWLDGDDVPTATHLTPPYHRPDVEPGSLVDQVINAEVER